MLEKAKNLIFDIFYNLIWVKEWILFGCFGLSVLCFGVYAVSTDTVHEFSNITDYDAVEVSGIVEEWYYHRGGSKSGTKHLFIELEDGIECYLLNDVLGACLSRGILESIQKGNIAEVHIFNSGTNYSPRIYAISINGISYLSPEDGMNIYLQEAEVIKSQNQSMVIAGGIFLLYPIIVFLIRKFLDR